MADRSPLPDAKFMCVRKHLLRATACVSIAITAACGQQNPSAEAVAVNDTRDQIARVNALTKQVTELEAQVADALLIARRVDNEWKVERVLYQSATFDPTDSAFQRVDSQLGSFAVSVQDVRQFGDGVKIRLNLGNLSSASYAGAKLSLRYGPRYPTETAAADYWDKVIKWRDAMKSKEHTVTQDLLSGRWNPVPIVLPSIEEKNFGFLEVKVTTNTIRLY